MPHSLITPSTRQASPAPSPPISSPHGSPNVLGIYNENRGPSDGVVFVNSALDRTGIANVAGDIPITTANHLQLGWHSSACAQIAAWLG